MRLSRAQLQAYQDNGYVFVESVLSEEQLHEARRIVDDFVEQSRAVRQHTEIFDLEPSHTPQNPCVRRLKHPVKIHPFFDRLACSGNVLDVVSELIGPGVRYHGSKLNMKCASLGSPVEWHQDFAFYPHSNDDLLACGIALDDCTEENGCLMVIPGSHRGPILDHHQDGRFAGAIHPGRSGVDLTKAVPVIVKAGAMSVHHVRLIHGSAPNQSAKSRRLFLLELAAVDAWPLYSLPNIPEFDAKILRGKPAAVYRMTNLQVRVPFPPPEQTGSIYEIQSTMKERYFAK